MSRLGKHSLLTFCLAVGAVSVCAAQTSGPPKKASPESCEYNSAVIGHMRYIFLQGTDKDTWLIAVARLGSGETSRELNRRRLYNLGLYLKGYDLLAKRLILAEGERVNGYGRVEFYVSGKLFDEVSVRRGKDLCVVCCGEDEEYYPWLDKRPRRKTSITGRHNKALQLTAR